MMLGSPSGGGLCESNVDDVGQVHSKKPSLRSASFCSKMELLIWLNQIRSAEWRTGGGQQCWLNIIKVFNDWKTKQAYWQKIEGRAHMMDPFRGRTVYVIIQIQSNVFAFIYRICNTDTSVFDEIAAEGLWGRRGSTSIRASRVPLGQILIRLGTKGEIGTPHKDDISCAGNYLEFCCESNSFNVEVPKLNGAKTV